jgi:hypothetical protein
MSKFEKGTSGNPAGRPSHAVTAAKLRELISADDVQDILTAVITQAKTGDMTAAKIILDRVCPALKPQNETVILEIASNDNLGTIAQLIFDQVARGEITPETGSALFATLTAQDSAVKIQSRRESQAKTDNMFGF